MKLHVKSLLCLLSYSHCLLHFRGRVIACYREFLCQYYELKLKSEAPWKNAPCYIGDYMQQLGGLSCGIHVARVVETLVLGVPFNNLEFNVRFCV